jgi:hypothetical protein
MADDLTLKRHGRDMTINGPSAPSRWRGSELAAMHTKHAERFPCHAVSTAGPTTHVRRATPVYTTNDHPDNSASVPATGPSPSPIQ